MTAIELSSIKTATEYGQNIIHRLNSLSTRPATDIVNEWAGKSASIQSMLFLLVINFFSRLAWMYQNGYYDLRNEYSCLASYKIIKLLDAKAPGWNVVPITTPTQEEAEDIPLMSYKDVVSAVKVWETSHRTLMQSAYHLSCLWLRKLAELYKSGNYDDSNICIREKAAFICVMLDTSNDPDLDGWDAPPFI